MKTIATLLIATTFPAAALSAVRFSEMTCTESAGYTQEWPGGAPADVLVTGTCPSLAEWFDPEFHRQLIRIYDDENQPFSFISFQTYDASMVFTSNIGGHLITEYTTRDPLNPNNERHDPTYVLGPLFQDVHWIHLDYGHYGPGDYEHFQFGNFVFGPANPCTFNPTLCPPTTTVSEPATTLLVAGALGFLAITRRRRQRT